MKYLVPIFLLIILPSCSSGPNENTTPEKKKIATKEEVPEPSSVKEEVAFKTWRSENNPKKIAGIKRLLNFRQDIEEYLEWTDVDGKHLVITSESGTYWSYSESDEDTSYQNTNLSCLHYVQKDGKIAFTQSWKIYDHVLDCPVDAITKFCKNTLQKTDLDNDGIPEIWIMYHLACKGDISPDVLKLIMYEGNVKYKMTGLTLADIGDGATVGGNIESKGKFTEQTDFLNFALRLWDKNKGNI